MDSTQAKAFVASLQGQTINGWKISGYLGEGKSAVVLSAFRGGVHAAIKVFHPELIERFGRTVQLERIARERSLIGQSHPNLVNILDGGECTASGHLYVVMELVPYKTLRKVLKEVPPDAVPQLIAQVASAARFLEDLGLVHRDIKPDNIGVSDDYSRAVLLDLGVIKPVLAENVTDVDARPFIGTLRYSSPEFLLRQEQPTKDGGRALTFYQLGAVLHDLLMRRPLFSHYDQPYSILVQAVINERPEIYGDDVRSVSLAKRCLVKNPATRLELVQWSDFLDRPAEASANLAALHAKLKARQTYLRADSQSTPLLATERDRLAKQRIEDAANRFVSRVASILNASDLFPLRTTKSAKNLAESSCTTLIKFEKDSELGLDAHLTARFVITLVDDNNGDPMYKAASCWAIANGDVAPEMLHPLVEFFSGGLDALMDSPTLEEQFVAALELAYEQTDKGVKLAVGAMKILSQGSDL